jgi:hypothetical protein
MNFINILFMNLTRLSLTQIGNYSLSMYTFNIFVVFIGLNGCEVGGKKENGVWVFIRWENENMSVFANWWEIKIFTCENENRMRDQF